MTNEWLVFMNEDEEVNIRLDAIDRTEGCGERLEVWFKDGGKVEYNYVSAIEFKPEPNITYPDMELLHSKPLDRSE
jgi:hypothetical protein